MNSLTNDCTNLHDYDDLSVTYEIAESNLNFPWNWESLSENPSVPSKIVIINQKVAWNWYMLSLNPSTHQKL